MGRRNGGDQELVAAGDMRPRAQGRRYQVAAEPMGPSCLTARSLFPYSLSPLRKNPSLTHCFSTLPQITGGNSELRYPGDGDMICYIIHIAMNNY